MALSVHKLTAKTIAGLTADGRYSDGGGLYLQIGNGGKSWLFRFTSPATGKRRELGLGSASAVSLADAREQADEMRRQVARGIDPLDLRVAEGVAKRRAAMTFGRFADSFMESTVKKEFHNVKHIYQWKVSLERYAAPLRDKPLHTITTEDVKACLDPIWHQKHETASRTRQRIERVLSAAKAAGLRDGANPAAWRDNLQPFYGRQRKATVHLAALPYNDVPAFMRKLDDLTSTSANALEFTILTAARTGETLGARMAEFDLKAKVWTVPAERMKMRKAHRVPLCDRAVAIVKAVRDKLADPDNRNVLVFPNVQGDRMSDMAMLQCLRGLRDGVTVHGFRSTFRDWIGDCTSYPRELVETALAHRIEDDAERAYRRTDALERRREMMAAWADYCGGRSKVVALRGQKRA